MLHIFEFAWMLRFSVWVMFNNFLLIDATDRSNISSNQKWFVIVYILFHFSRTLPFKVDRVDAAVTEKIKVVQEWFDDISVRLVKYLWSLTERK